MYKHFFKRVFDFILALLGLIILSPLFLVVAVAIKIDDPGPVFFKQKRVGINKTYFNLYKFHTARKNRLRKNAAPCRTCCIQRNH